MTKSDESFLARWSRRKRSAAPKTLDSPKPGAATGSGATPDAAPASVAPNNAPPPVDPGPLPPLESIGAGSDIRPFLAAGVPAELMRAALRRAWSVDPAIRDFIGLSENAWDFTAPGGVPGFGTITADEVRRLLGQVNGEPEPANPPPPAAKAASAAPVSESSPAMQVSSRVQPVADHDAGAGHDGSTPPGTENTAVQ